MKTKFFGFIILCVICFHNVIECGLFSKSNQIDVKTTSGEVRGQIIKVWDDEVNEFWAIPYGAAPVGKLRFAKPKPYVQKGLFKGTIDATKPNYTCYQSIMIDSVTPSSEDCLFLNIWAIKPVMVFIHGGGLIMGSGYAFNGKVLATFDVVVVTLNYRLGVLGWMYGDDENTAPGNMGLYDQLLELKWVKENIHAFKGDPKRITLFGEGAGSWSVAAHIISPLTKGLFNRAILSSGALLEFKNGFLNKTEALKQSKEMAKQFGCQLKGMFAKNWIECLKDPKKINTNELSKYTSFFAYPVYGTEYLPYNAQTAFKKGKFRDDIELMAGVTTNEGPIITKFVYPATNIQSIASKQDFQFTVNRMPFDGLKTDKIIDFYISRDKDPFATDRFNTAFNEFYADFRTVCPTYLFAQLFAKYSSDGNVYFYQYTKRPVAQCESHNMSRCHVGEDMSFVFGEPVLLTPSEAPKPSAVSTITTAIVAQQKARLAAQKVQKAKLAQQQRAKAAARPVKVAVTTSVQQVVVAQPADTVLPAAGQEQPASPPADPNAATPVGDGNPPPPQDPNAAPPAVAPADGQAPPPAPETSGQPVEVTTGAPIGGEVPPMAPNQISRKKRSNPMPTKIKVIGPKGPKVIAPKPAHEANDTEDTDAVTDTATEDTVLKESAPLPAPDTTAVAAPIATDPPSTPPPTEPIAGTVVAPVADTPVTEPPQPPPQEATAPVAGAQAVPDAASAPPSSDAQPVSEPPAPVVDAGAAQPIPEPISTADFVD